jgi:hypothetical protein
MVFEVAEEDIVLEIDGVVPDISIGYFFQYLWPDGTVILLVDLCTAGFQPNRHSMSLHCKSFRRDEGD